MITTVNIVGSVLVGANEDQTRDPSLSQAIEYHYPLLSLSSVNSRDDIQLASKRAIAQYAAQ